MARCEITGWSHQQTDTHHIHTRGAGGTDDEYNTISVCRYHHTQIHTGKIGLDGCYASVTDSKRVLEGAEAIRQFLHELVQNRVSIRQFFKEMTRGKEG